MIGQVERLVELNKLRRLNTLPHEKKNIVAFSSGKGGTGKTFLSLNTAFAMSRLNKKVLVVDLDANLSNLNIMVNIKTDKTLLNFYLNKSKLNDLIYKYDLNLHFIFGDSGKIDYPTISENQVYYFYDQLREISKNYDFVFLDVSSGASESIILFLFNADFNLLVTTPEPTAVMDAYVILKLLNNMEYPNQRFIIVNRCINQEEGKTAYENLNSAVTHFLKDKLELIGLIDNDVKVSKAILNQKLFLMEESDSRVSLQIKKLARNLLKSTQMVNNSQ